MKDRLVELTLVVRLDHRLDDDLEVLIRDYLESEGLLEVQEIVRVGLTGTIDLPRVWLPTATDEELETPDIDPPPRPAAPPTAAPPRASPKRSISSISSIFKKR